MNAVVARNVQAIRCVPHHPNVERVLGMCGCAQASMYIVSPFVETVPLLHHIKRSPTTQTKLQALLDVARALAHLHAHGMVHGEVKAENVIVNSIGSCILSGWARRAVWDEYTDAVFRECNWNTLDDDDYPRT
ncbi:hypothetical protein AURDEDRAFT_114961 [Auricularia subglabra TFB-10046 SS5]|nr:hypothetical protein AURDEDRAFT_114961 [Auricularia subglabra TFB-10046 SS5]